MLVTPGNCFGKRLGAGLLVSERVVRIEQLELLFIGRPGEYLAGVVDGNEFVARSV
jgi:hypothetical protein